MAAFLLQRDVATDRAGYRLTIRSIDETTPAFGGLFEPLYDEAVQLYFYAPGMWDTFTSFDIPQPVWVYSGYVTLYGATALFICRGINQGMSAWTL
jgi:hypothetical protein